MGILLIGIASAKTNTVDVSDTFKVNSLVDYSKPCFNNGTYCLAGTTCNFTITNPKGTIIIDNKESTNQVSRYNISFIAYEIGIYKSDMTCNDNGLTGSETFYFEVTPSGNNESIGFFLILLGVGTGLLVLGFWIKEAWLVIFGGMIFMILGVYSWNDGIAGVRNLFTTWALGCVFVGVGAYLSFESAYELITENLGEGN